MQHVTFFIAAICIHFDGSDNHNMGVFVHFFINNYSLIVLIFSGLWYGVPLIGLCSAGHG